MTSRSLKSVFWRMNSVCTWILRGRTSVMNAASGLALIVTSRYTCARTWAISRTLVTCEMSGSYIAAWWRYTDGSIQVKNHTSVTCAASRSLKSVLWRDTSGFTRTRIVFVWRVLNVIHSNRFYDETPTEAHLILRIYEIRDGFRELKLVNHFIIPLLVF